MHSRFGKLNLVLEGRTLCVFADGRHDAVMFIVPHNLRLELVRAMNRTCSIRAHKILDKLEKAGAMVQSDRPLDIDCIDADCVATA